MSILLYTDNLQVVRMYQHLSTPFLPSILHLYSGLPYVPVADDEDETSIPCTSKPCQWKPPKKRKESNLRLSDATFEKHDYAKPVKRKVRKVEDFDPRPESFINQASKTLKSTKRRTTLCFTSI